MGRIFLVPLILIMGRIFGYWAPLIIYGTNFLLLGPLHKKMGRAFGQIGPIHMLKGQNFLQWPISPINGPNFPSFGPKLSVNGLNNLLSSGNSLLGRGSFHRVHVILYWAELSVHGLYFRSLGPNMYAWVEFSLGPSHPLMGQIFFQWAQCMLMDQILQ